MWVNYPLSRTGIKVRSGPRRDAVVLHRVTRLDRDHLLRAQDRRAMLRLRSKDSLELQLVARLSLRRLTSFQVQSHLGLFGLPRGGCHSILQPNSATIVAGPGYAAEEGELVCPDDDFLSA